MSSKKEEVKAFERLKKEFPGKDVSLTIYYCSWRKEQVCYATVNSVGSTVGSETETAAEAVNRMIEGKEALIKT